MPTLIRCHSCSDGGAFFYDKGLTGCPRCGTPRRGRNGHLDAAKLNAHLYATAERAEREQKQEAAQVRAARKEAKRRGA